MKSLVTVLYALLSFALRVWSKTFEEENLDKADRNSIRHNASLILNGHYVMWPTNKTQDRFIKDKRYIPKNIIYTRFQRCSDRVFLAAPRYKRGVPFTLGYVTLADQNKCYNYVKPFPCIDKQGTGTGVSVSDESLINAIDIVMGPDGVIWVLDAGISDTLSDHPSRDGDPKIVGFDASTGKIKHMITLRPLSCRARSRLQYLVVEYMKNMTTVLYVGDGGTRSIIVWYVQSNEGCRIKLPQTVVQGCTENAHDDVFYIALVETEANNYIYFTYLSSQDVFRARTKDLRKRINPKCIVNMGKKPCKMVFLGVGYGSVLYFRIKGQNHLFSWDAKQSFLEENFKIVRKSKDCRTITHVDVDSDGVLWVLESNIQDFIMNQVGCYGPCMLLTPVFEAPVSILSESSTKDNLIA